MRYYNFAFPLLFMIAASQLSLPAAAISRGWRGAVALPIALAIVYAILTRLAPYTPSPFDCPELRGFTQQSTIFSILGILSLIALALWVYSAEAGIKMFVRVFMPLSVVLSGVYVNQELRSLLAPDEFGEAGICARQRLPEEERSKVVVVGTDERGLYKTLFYLDNPHATFATIPEGDPCDLTKLPADKEWALVIGDHALPEHAAFETPLNGFTLGRIRGADAIDVGRPGILGIRSSDFHN
jgi:phosphoglycerol transferase